MELFYGDVKKFEKAFSKYYPVDKCECGGLNEMDLFTVKIYIELKQIIVKECPVLICQKCGKKLIGRHIPRCIHEVYMGFESHPESRTCETTILGDGRFEYAQKANFIYDSRDMNIPGCDAEYDALSPLGFFLPVYFSRKVLNSFLTDNDYELDFVSESYGMIAKKVSNEWKYEWQIFFGVNKNDNVVFFLGHLDQIKDERSIFMLKSYNIPSDHCLIDTEFYQAQLNAEFSDLIIERRIFQLRKGLYKRIAAQFKIALWNSEDIVSDKESDIKKPVMFSKQEISQNIILMNEILNEGVSLKDLRSLCRLLGVAEDISQLKSIKLFEKMIALQEGDSAAETIIGPLYRLNDARQCFSHLLSDEKLCELQQNVVQAYGLSDFSEYQKWYEHLIKDLYSLYKYLYVTDFARQNLQP